MDLDAVRFLVDLTEPRPVAAFSRDLAIATAAFGASKPASDPLPQAPGAGSETATPTCQRVRVLASVKVDEPWVKALLIVTL
jgi:hypothetical protein